MKRRFFLTVFLIAGWILLLPAQQTERVWEKIPLPHTGFVNVFVNDIAIDKSGAIWLAVFSDLEKGIGGFKYVEPDGWEKFFATEHHHPWDTTGHGHGGDGDDDDDDEDEFGEESRQEIGASNNKCVAIDRQGNAWFGAAYHGACRLSGTTWRHFSTISGLAGNTVSDILLYKDTIWIATDSGLNIFANDSIKLFKSQPTAGKAITCLANDLSGNLWVGTNEGLCKFNGTNWGLPHCPASNVKSDNYVDALTIDSKGNVWAAIWHKGIYMYNGTSWSKQFDECTQGSKSIYITSLAFDKKGHLWAGCSGYGVWEYDGKNWTNYTQEDSSLCDNRVLSIAVDAKGTVWIGSVNCLTKVYDKSLSVLNMNGFENSKVYPNPVQNKCTVTNVEEATIEIYTVAGQKTGTYYSEDKDITIDASGLPSGLYMLKIEKDNFTRFFKISVVH